MRCRNSMLGVKPLQRSDPQPVRVIHNGRFSLPAGTYTIAVQFNDRGADRPLPLSLQVGRNGPPLQTWTLQPQPGEQWQTTLWLPVDASFVGLRGPVELERAIAAITITPTAVVDAGARPLVPIVLAAAKYPAATLFFHNEQLYPEPQGFWTHRRAGVARHRGVCAGPGRAGRDAHASGRESQQRDGQHVRLAATITTWCPGRPSKSSCRSSRAASCR